MGFCAVHCKLSVVTIYNMHYKYTGYNVTLCAETLCAETYRTVYQFTKIDGTSLYSIEMFYSESPIFIHT